jgi:hypothetical protein
VHPELQPARLLRCDGRRWSIEYRYSPLSLLWHNLRRDNGSGFNRHLWIAGHWALRGDSGIKRDGNNRGPSLRSG